MNANAPNPDDQVTIQLSKPHALVLFEFLSRVSADDKLEIQDQAEARVLWDVCCDLEKTLVEPLRTDYFRLLREARDTVRDKLE